jgi:hypothetical protein
MWGLDAEGVIKVWKNVRASMNCSAVRLGVPSSRPWAKRGIEWVGLGVLRVFAIGEDLVLNVWTIAVKGERSGWRLSGRQRGGVLWWFRGLLSDEVRSSSIDEQSGREEGGDMPSKDGWSGVTLESSHGTDCICGSS